MTCHVWRVMCDVSHVTCDMSHVMCHMSHVMFFLCFFRTKGWSLAREGLLSTGPTLSSYSSIHEFIYQSIDLFNCTSIHLPIYPSIQLSTYPPIHLSINTSIHLSIYIKFWVNTKKLVPPQWKKCYKAMKVLKCIQWQQQMVQMICLDM